MINQHEQSWLAVVAHANAEIEKRRSLLEMAGMPADASEFERGAIAALRGVIALAETDTASIPPPTVDYMRR